MTISNEDIKDWEVNPVTKAVQKKLAEAGLESLSQIVIQETCDETAMRAAECIGFSNGCLSWEDAVDSVKEDCQ